MKTLEALVTRQTSYDELPALLSIKEAARWYNCSTSAVYAKLKRGELHYIRLGHMIRIPREALGV